MHRSFALVRAALVVIGLLLAGPQKASAKAISACVASGGPLSGSIIVVAANANCPANGGGVTWTKITLSTTPGITAGAAFNCPLPQTINPGGAMSFQPSSLANFGSAIGTPGTPPFNTFTLQPGIYSINLSAFFLILSPNEILATLNGTTQGRWPPFGQVFVGETLISVSQPNTALSFPVTTAVPVALAETCALTITKVQ